MPDESGPYYRRAFDVATRLATRTRLKTPSHRAGPRPTAADDSLTIWRDSVAAGDDADAPHEWRIAADPDATVDRVVRTILSARYLATIAGGEATWIVEGTRPLAVVAQQWTEPSFLVDPLTPIHAVVRASGVPHLEVRYWTQVAPERVVEALRDGTPLPDRYGR